MVHSIGVALATALIMGLIIGLFIGTLAAPAGARKHPPIPKPPEWADRVLPFVHFVERSRGFEFDHPVNVALLSERAFNRRVQQTFFAGPDAGFREFVSQLSALGLVGSEETASDLAEGGVVFGFFNPFSEDVVVRGSDLDEPAVRVVLVHELAHALVAQQFRSLETSSAAGTFAYQALLEGDATVVQAAYTQSLTAKDRASASDGLSLPDEFSSVINAVTGAPYVLGGAYIEALAALGSRNAAFRNPPSFDQEIMDPFGDHVAQDRRSVDGLPKLGVDERRRGPVGELGALLVFLTLSARLDVETALESALGVAGDRYLLFKRDGRDCMHFAVRGVNQQSTDDLADTFQQWAVQRPLGATVVTAREHDVLVTSCETERPPAPVTDPSEAVGLVLGGRLYWSSQAVRGGETRLVARCVGTAMAADPQVLAAHVKAVAEGRRGRELRGADRVAVLSRFDDNVAACRTTADLEK